MTTEEIATMMGIRIVRCDATIWGGSWGYTNDEKGYSCYGYKTKKQMIERLIRERFKSGELGKLCLNLLLKYEPVKGGDK
jgi:hypothetical protein